MSTQIWQHKTAGDRYAVEIDSNTGVVIDVWGPLAADEVATAQAGEWESGMDPEALEAVCDEMNTKGDEYMLIYPR